jgi:hypothetical protein
MKRSRACGLALVATLATSAGGLVFAAGPASPKKPRIARAPQFRIYPGSVDQYVFGAPEGGLRFLPEWQAAALRRRVDDVGKLLDLSDSQKRKLELAGKGDIDRFVAQVDRLKRKWPPGEVTQAQFNQMAQECGPLCESLAQGLFQNGSLFEKTLLATLRPDQIERYEQVERERLIYSHRAAVGFAVMQLDGILGLSDDQRRQLTELILNKTRPLRCSDRRRITLSQISLLPDESLKPLFDADQWRQLSRKLATVRQEVPALRRTGIVFDNESNTRKEPPAP